MPAYSQALAANKPEILKADAFPGLLMRRRYGYDAASLLTHIDEQHFAAGNPAHNLLARYDYDRQGRLTGWTHSRFASATAPEWKKGSGLAFCLPLLPTSA